MKGFFFFGGGGEGIGRILKIGFVVCMEGWNDGFFYIFGGVNIGKEEKWWIRFFLDVVVSEWWGIYK